jgi:putative spermidine/putrescine transport system substrate-binding protein
MMGVMGLALMAGQGEASARDLTVVSFGGSLQDAIRASFIQPFTKSTGKAVVEDTYDGALSKISSQVETGAVNWDVVDVESNELRQGCEEGYFEKIDASSLKAELMPAALSTSPCGVGYMSGAMVLGYDKSVLKDGPQTWADFWDMQRFPGKRGMRFGPKWTLEIALMADGVPADKVYTELAAPGGVDRAFKKLDEIKSSISWWKVGAESVQMLASGNVSMVAAYNGRIVAANRSEGRQFAMGWDAGSLYFLDYFAIVKGSQNNAAAQDFIRYAVSEAPQTTFPSNIGYAPVNLKSFGSLPDAIKADLPTSEAYGKAVVTDDQFWLDHGDELTQRFNVWAAQ